MRRRLLRLLRDPVGVVKRRVRLAVQLIRYGGLRGELAERFWSDRHAQYGADDLRGVGMESWTHAENTRDYTQAGEIVMEVLAAEGLDLTAARTLDVGCGTGFYAGLLREAGVSSYLGLDIASTLLADLRARFDGFQFEQLDITSAPPGGEYDLIVMIDVTQHLVAEGAFERACAHLRDALAPGGLLLVTSWLRGPERLSFFEQARPLSAYQEQFPAPSYRIGEPRWFRRKHLLTIRRV